VRAPRSRPWKKEPDELQALWGRRTHRERSDEATLHSEDLLEKSLERDQGTSSATCRWPMVAKLAPNQ